jgi:hypothetical protein
MSNTEQGCTQEETLFAAATVFKPGVRFFNLAISGDDALAWQTGGSAWSQAISNLTGKGGNPDKVAVVQIYNALKQASQYGTPLEYAKTLHDKLNGILDASKSNFKNASLFFFGVRERAYTDDPQSLNPEEYAKYSQLSVKWTVEDHLAAGGVYYGPLTWVEDPFAAATPDKPAVNEEGFTWCSADVESGDHTHLTDSGAKKVAAAWLKFYQTDPIASKALLK